MKPSYSAKKPSQKEGTSPSKRRHRRRDVHEKSCGIIVFRAQSEERLFLLLHYPGGHWDFPKGHVEKKDADEHATALRELDEETGIKTVTFVGGYREPMYYEFNRGQRERVKKVVVYFVGETTESEVKISFEHKGFEWLPYDLALKRLTYDNARDLLKKAAQHLNANE